MNMGAWSFINQHIYSAANASSVKRKHPAMPKYAGRYVNEWGLAGLAGGFLRVP